MRINYMEGTSTTTMEIIDACVGTLDTVRYLTEQAGVNFVKFMEDKWDLFDDADLMTCVQTYDYQEMLEYFCSKSSTKESLAMLEYSKTLE